MARKNKNNEQEAYYTLRAVHATSGSAHNRQLMAGADTIHIGQTADCEWHFDNTTNYIDEVYAVIRPGQISGEWVLVPTSEHVSVSVNGTKVDLVHYLRDGDIIGFDGERQELRFNVHHDGRYSADIGVAYIPVKLSTVAKGWITVATVIVVVAVIVGVLWIKHNNDMREEQVIQAVDAVSSSVYQITIDSVYYLSRITVDDVTPHTDTLGCYSYATGTGFFRGTTFKTNSNGIFSGTAFVANDSLLITARHCIQPWLNDDTINHVIRPTDLPQGPVRWAFEAETENQLSGDFSRSVISVCTVWGGSTGSTVIGRYTSADFVVDSIRDDIVEKGDYYTTCYWRNIWRRNGRWEMMLGDVAYKVIDTEGTSSLTLATTDMMNSLTHGRTLYYLGYPNYQENGYSFLRGMLQRNYADGELLVHDGMLQHGYSGGPVVIFDENRKSVTVVGVISVADNRGDNQVYSVPVSVITKQLLQYNE